MNRLRHTILAAAVFLLLAACGDAPPDPSHVEAPRSVLDEAPPVPEQADIMVPAADGNVGFQVRLAGRLNCADPESATTASVNWDTSALGVTGVDIYVQSPEEGEAPKLWVSGPAKGSESTPPWVRPGATFELRAQADQKVLASYSARCS